jgi:hypothetical protein
MAAIKKQHLKLLEPYFAGETPSIRGEDRHRELDMFCPLHPDKKRSATLDLDKALWYCAAGCGGGRVPDLIERRDEWVTPRRNGTSNGNGGSRKSSNGSKPQEQISEGTVKGWISSLIGSPERLEELVSRRGVEEEILEAYEIGWDGSQRAYTIPIRDAEGQIVNVRRYQFDPPNDRRKIWSVSGMGSPARLFPIDVLQDEPDEIIVCEGEWDALLTIQNGFPCITRTAAASVWNSDWGEYFHGRKVYLVHDMDSAGQAANRKVERMLRKIADVKVVHLPFPVEKKHGKDLTDYWLAGHSPSDFRALLEGASVEEGAAVQEEEIEEVTIADTFDASKRGKPVQVYATVKGRKEPNYIVPSTVKFECSRDAGQRCQICTLNGAGGEAEVEIDSDDPLILKMLGANEKQVFGFVAEEYGIPGGKCPRLEMDATTSKPVEILFARQAIDRSDVGDAYKTARITAVGNHNTPPNATYRVRGALHPNPGTQESEFLAWDVQPVQTALDTFELDEATARQLELFRPRKGQRPLKRLGYIARDFEDHVTHIYGRPEMHAAMDLVFHSVISFDFGGQRIDRGWLEGLFVGDTRTGKSETASALVRHYQAGEVVNCESASFAGIVGGLQQYGGREWSISWGAVPLNDRRLVVLDEVSGLSYEDVASMSDVRSRGVAQLTKIQQEATHARTRLIWVGNPRDGGMAQYTYGVQAIQPLVGNPEDIARFDLAMTASSHEVASEEINREHTELDETEFPSELCTALLRWVWSRAHDQIKWAKGAEQAVYAAAQQLGDEFVDSPPLVQAASVRVKIARIAVALAARLFSTDDGYENVLVRKEHVWDAVNFLRHIYNMPGFGYGELSRQRISARQEARSNRDDIRKWLRGRPGMATFLRENASFKRQDIEEVMNMNREEANSVINTLFHSRMVRKDKGLVYVEYELHQLIREVKR